MTEEEQKAIEYFEHKVKNKLPLYEETYINGKSYRRNILQLETNFTEEQANKTQIILNLISKQQTIIKQQSYTNKKMRNKIKTVRKERNKLKANIEKIQDYCKKTLAFERRLKRDKTTPDLFNQGRFTTCDDILKI